MPVSRPTLTGLIPEPAERAIRSLQDAVDGLESQVAALRAASNSAQLDRIAADLRTLTGRVDVLARKVQVLEG